MTELQKCEWEILRKALQILHREKLTYFLVCGSALGAVKYGGFIPWDDDVDIALPRDDYEKFLQCVKECETEDFTLQNYRYDLNVPFFYSKIRCGTTTYVEKASAHLNINHGVYIDVFPLDGYPGDKRKARVFEGKKRIFRRLLSAVFLRESAWKNAVTWPIRLLVKPFLNPLVGAYDCHLSQYPVADSEYICNHGNWQGKVEYAPREQYGEGTWAIFEGLKVRVPERYDEYLTQKYGDWRAELPPERQVGHHYYEIMDLTKPYTEYIPHKNSLT